MRGEGVSLRQQLSEVSYRDEYGHLRLNVEDVCSLLKLEKEEVKDLLNTLKVSFIFV